MYPLPVTEECNPMESFQLIIQYKIHKPLPKGQLSQVNMP